MQQSTLSFEQAATLPNELGVAGPFAGVHNDALIIAGGANFPRGFPWERSDDGVTPPKIYHSDVHVLVRDGEAYKWVSQTVKLPQAAAYGVSVSTPAGIVCIGGERKDKPFEGQQLMHVLSQVFRLSWNEEVRKVEVDTSLPDLPFGLTTAAGALVNNAIYVAGGLSQP